METHRTFVGRFVLMAAGLIVAGGGCVPTLHQVLHPFERRPLERRPPPFAPCEACCGGSQQDCCLPDGPCYGYHSTCWYPWPEDCVDCNDMMRQSNQAPTAVKPPLPKPKLPMPMPPMPMDDKRPVDNPLPVEENRLQDQPPLDAEATGYGDGRLPQAALERTDRLPPDPTDGREAVPEESALPGPLPGDQ